MGAIQLIRHGQASWGADDYDDLSDLGQRQGEWLGASWEASGYRPHVSVTGSLRRHAQTAVAVLDAIDGDLYDVDPGWDEYDHLALTGAIDVASRPADPREFQQQLDEALARWIAEGGAGDASDGGDASGGGAAAIGETFASFGRRVLGALERVVEQAGPGRQVAVFTSGGPIALVVSHLLAGDASLMMPLNRVMVNGSSTTLIVGRGGTRLLSFNEHTHIPREQVTFR